MKRLLCVAILLAGLCGKAQYATDAYTATTNEVADGLNQTKPLTSYSVQFSPYIPNGKNTYTTNSQVAADNSVLSLFQQQSLGAYAYALSISSANSNSVAFNAVVYSSEAPVSDAGAGFFGGENILITNQPSGKLWRLYFSQSTNAPLNQWTDLGTLQESSLGGGLSRYSITICPTDAQANSGTLYYFVRRDDNKYFQDRVVTAWGTNVMAFGVNTNENGDAGGLVFNGVGRIHLYPDQDLMVFNGQDGNSTLNLLPNHSASLNGANNNADYGGYSIFANGAGYNTDNGGSSIFANGASFNTELGGNGCFLNGTFQNYGNESDLFANYGSGNFDNVGGNAFFGTAYANNVDYGGQGNLFLGSYWYVGSSGNILMGNGSWTGYLDEGYPYQDTIAGVSRIVFQNDDAELTATPDGLYLNGNLVGGGGGLPIQTGDYPTSGMKIDETYGGAFIHGINNVRIFAGALGGNDFGLQAFADGTGYFDTAVMHMRDINNSFNDYFYYDGNGHLGVMNSLPSFSLDVGGDVNASGVVRVGGTQVLTFQQGVINDATGAGDVVATVNYILAALRAHGLIATSPGGG